MTKTIRIAIFADNFYPEISGISDSIITTARTLAERGHHIRFYAPHYGRADYEKVKRDYREPDLHPNIGIVRFSAIPFPTPTGQGRMVIPVGLRALGVKEWSPDILHVHLPLGTGLEGVFAAWALRRPLVGTDHTPVSQFLKYIPLGGTFLGKFILHYNVWFYNRCDFMSSPTKTVIEEARRLGLRRPAHAVPNPVRTELFQPMGKRAALKKKLGLEGFTVAYAGRLAPEKKIDEVIRAAARAGISAAVIGNGPDFQRLRALAKELGAEERVHFFGFLEDAKFVEVLNACDAFAMMSTAETQSIAMMNGMACGLPVVAARAWGLPEYVPPGAGFLVEPGDVSALADRLRELKTDSSLYDRLSKGARKHAEAFSQERIADLWESIYRDTITKRKK